MAGQLDRRPRGNGPRGNRDRMAKAQRPPASRRVGGCADRPRSGADSALVDHSLLFTSPGDCPARGHRSIVAGVAAERGGGFRGGAAESFAGGLRVRRGRALSERDARAGGRHRRAIRGACGGRSGGAPAGAGRLLRELESVLGKAASAPVGLIHPVTVGMKLPLPGASRLSQELITLPAHRFVSEKVRRAVARLVTIRTTAH